MPTSDKAPNARKVTDLSVALAAQLRAERAYADITVEELARRSRVSKNTLMAILNGQKPADVSQLANICEALGVEILDVFSRTEERMRTGARQGRRQASSG